MKRKELALGICAGVALAAAVVLLFDKSETAFGQSPGIPSGISQQAGVVAVPAAGGGHFVVVVDTAQQVMGSYLVNAESGHITLRSVRNYHWDLQMEEFNGAEPRPSEVREMLHVPFALKRFM